MHGGSAHGRPPVASSLVSLSGVFLVTRNLLLQLDSSPIPSVFDQVVAYDGGADVIMSYGGIVPAQVRDLVHGCIFTRSLKELHHTAIWIGGASLADGQALLTAAQEAVFTPFTVSMMLDSNGANTTAVAGVVKIEETVGDVRGKRAVVIAGTGPCGMRAAGLLARNGADVLITSRREEDGIKARDAIVERFGGTVAMKMLRESSHLDAVMDGAQILFNAGPAGVQLVPAAAWQGRKGLEVAVDLNAVPPLGVEGIGIDDHAKEIGGVICYGAIGGVGNFKTKLHKACIAQLFTRKDLVLDAEAIYTVAKEMSAAA